MSDTSLSTGPMMTRCLVLSRCLGSNAMAQCRYDDDLMLYWDGLNVIISGTAKLWLTDTLFDGRCSLLP